MLNQQWVPYCRQYKSIVLLLLLLSACGPIHLFEKEMDDAKTQNLGPVMHTLGTYNKTQNLCTSSINMCLDIIGQFSSQGEKKQTKHFVFSATRTHCWLHTL
jgi:hypothetical protein